jgi:hypothetical protein
MKKTITLLLISLLVIGSISAQTVKVTTSTALSAPTIYIKSSTDTLVSNSIARAIKPIVDLNLKQDASIKIMQDSIKMLRDSIRILSDKYSSFRDVYFGDGFTIAQGKVTDTIKNTATISFKSILDSIMKIVSGKLDSSKLPGYFTSFSVGAIDPIKIVVDRHEKTLTSVDLILLKSDLDKISAALKIPILR